MTVKWQERVLKCGKCEVRSSLLATPARLYPTRTHGWLTGQSTSEKVPRSTCFIHQNLREHYKYFAVEYVSAPFLRAFVIHASIFSHVLRCLMYVSIYSSHTSCINIVQYSSSKITTYKISQLTLDSSISEATFRKLPTNKYIHINQLAHEAMCYLPPTKSQETESCVELYNIMCQL